MICRTAIMPNLMKPDPSYDDYIKRWSELYQSQNYDNGLTGYFLRKSHAWAEADFGPDIHFGKVLEVGAGTGMHIKFIRHSYDEYWVTDHNQPLMDKITLPETAGKRGKLCFAVEDAAQLTFPDASFDRLIAAHVLEHLYQPHKVLREWARVLKPGGVISLALPCDPGLLWRLGRYAVARNKFIKAGFDYDYWMARDHVNSINNLASFIRYYFPDVSERWRPCRVPSMDLNLFYIAHVVVKEK